MCLMRLGNDVPIWALPLADLWTRSILLFRVRSAHPRNRNHLRLHNFAPIPRHIVQRQETNRAAGRDIKGKKLLPGPMYFCCVFGFARLKLISLFHSLPRTSRPFVLCGSLRRVFFCPFLASLSINEAARKDAASCSDRFGDARMSALFTESCLRKEAHYQIQST